MENEGLEGKDKPTNIFALRLKTHVNTMLWKAFFQNFCIFSSIFEVLNIIILFEADKFKMRKKEDITRKKEAARFERAAYILSWVFFAKNEVLCKVVKRK